MKRFSMLSFVNVCIFVLFTTVVSLIGIYCSEEENTPQFTLDENTLLIPDIIYRKGAERDLKLDLYLPKEGNPSYPGIVFIHGGGWREGTKNHFRRQASYMADKGYVCACIEYNLSGEAPFPAAIHDCKAAVRWMRAHASEYNIDKNRIAAVGGSAGGHLASLLATSGGVEELEGTGPDNKYSSRVRLLVAFNGHHELGDKKLKETETLFLGGTVEEVPEIYKIASPFTYIDKSDPPALLLHGNADQSVPYEQSIHLKEALEEAGVPVEFYTAEGKDHAWFNYDPDYEPMLKRMEEFINKYFKPPLPQYENTEVIRDIVYRQGVKRQLTLDLYSPKEGNPPYPAIVFIHGGGWSRGTKNYLQKHASYFASKGIVSASIDYNLSGEAPFPAAIHDCKAAVRWMRAHADEYNIDTNRIAAAGGSAGGHLTALLGTSGGVKELEGTGPNGSYSSRVSPIIVIEGHVILGARESKSETLFLGGTYDEIPETYRMASPFTYIDKSDPPVLLLHGTDDTSVPFEESVKFKEQLEKAGVSVELQPFEGGEHSFMHWYPHYEPALKRMEEFIYKYFGTPK